MTGVRATMEQTRYSQEIAFSPCRHLVLLIKPATHRSLLKV